MDSVVCSHRVYKLMWLPVIYRRTTCPRERTCMLANPHDKFAIRGSDKRFSNVWPLSIGYLVTDHMVLYYTKGLCRPLSGICHITGRRGKGKGSVVPSKFNYYCEPIKDPVLIRDLAFIFAIMLFPPATKQDQEFIRDQPSFEAIRYINLDCDSTVLRKTTIHILSYGKYYSSV